MAATLVASGRADPSPREPLDGGLLIIHARERQSPSGRFVGLNTPVPWSVVLPVKSIDQGKSRLLAQESTRRLLIAAFLADVLAALDSAHQVGEVIVVGNDPVLLDLAVTAGARAITEGESRGLNQAAAIGISAASQAAPVAVMVADLPCLTGSAIDHVLHQASALPNSFVCDAAGTGTTMLMAQDPRTCRPQFGHRSRARHAASGNVELAAPSGGAAPSGELVSPDGIQVRAQEAFCRARRDVDTQVDLWDAVRIGVGSATRAVLPSIGGLTST